MAFSCKPSSSIEIMMPDQGPEYNMASCCCEICQDLPVSRSTILSRRPSFKGLATISRNYSTILRLPCLPRQITASSPMWLTNSPPTRRIDQRRPRTLSTPHQMVSPCRTRTKHSVLVRTGPSCSRTSISSICSRISTANVSPSVLSTPRALVLTASSNVPIQFPT